MNLMVPDVIWEPLERLSDRDFRRVMLAMRAVNEGEEPEALEGEAGIIWMFARRYVEDNRKAYRAMCAQNARNARKRWKKRSHATAYNRTGGETDEDDAGCERDDGCDRMRPDATAQTARTAKVMKRGKARRGAVKRDLRRMDATGCDRMRGIKKCVRR